MLTLALVLLAPLAPGSPAVAREAVALAPSGVCTAVGFRRVPVARRPAREAWLESSLDRDSSRGATTNVLVGGLSFSAVRTFDLRLQVGVSPSVAPTRLEFHLYTPKGHLYQALSATTPGPPADPTAPVPWTATLPVAGTSIVNHSLYGRWRVVPHLDGDPRPCGPAQRFSITP